MGGDNYRVVLLGIKAGHDPQTVKQQLARRFCSTPHGIAQLLSRTPLAVKSEVSLQTAIKYRDAISKAGGVCRVETAQRSSPLPPSPPKSLYPLKTCPNCRYDARTSEDPLFTAHDGRGECPSCGIIVSKFNQARCAPRSDRHLPAGRSRKRPFRFWFGAAVVVVAALAIAGVIGQLTVRKIALKRLGAQVDAYDQKIHSLATEKDTGRAIEDLFRLYDSVAESVPGFSWGAFNPDRRFDKFFTNEDIAAIDQYLRPRKRALLKSMREAAPNGKILYGYRIDDIEENLWQYELCVIKKLEGMIGNGRKQTDRAGSMAGINCDQVAIGPLSARRTNPLAPDQFSCSQ